MRAYLDATQASVRRIPLPDGRGEAGYVRLDTRAVRDAYGSARGDVRRYQASLLALNEAMRSSNTL